MTNLDSILKSRDITLPTKVHLVKAMVFPVVMYGCALTSTQPLAGGKIGGGGSALGTVNAWDQPCGVFLFCLPGRLKMCHFILFLSICLLWFFVFNLRERCSGHKL